MLPENLKTKLVYNKIRIMRECTKALNDITPPVLARALMKSKNKARGQSGSGETESRQTRHEQRFDMAKSVPEDVRFCKGSPVFDVPMEKLRYTNSISYLHPLHHMRRYYAEGETGFREFYDTHHPRNIFEKHFLASPEGRSIPHGGVPWSVLLDGRYEAEYASKGLSASEGPQEYGPASDTKISFEAERLNRIRNSIEQNGFSVKYGMPSGYFLQANSGDWVCVVMGGRHRIGAMAHLGFKSVPMIFDSKWPRLIHERDVEIWPMVRAEDISADDALEVFQAYFPLERELVLASPEK